MRYKNTRNSILILGLLSLQACASMTSGSQQSLSVTTEPVTGATCQLNNDAGSWFIPSTPGSVTVHREASDLTVVCKKGALSGTARVVSFTKGVAYGNILAGGLIGAAIDRSNGSAFDYPALIGVPMSTKGTFTEILPPEEVDTKEGINTRRNSR